MGTHDGGSHHLHKRKRLTQKLEPYPSPDKFKRNYDVFMYAIAFIGPLMTVPQLINVWYYKTVAGVSILTFLGFVFVNVCWIIYGIIHKEKQIIISGSMWFVLQLAVVIGVLKFA